MHQLRVEKILYLEQPLALPICTAGKRLRATRKLWWPLGLSAEKAGLRALLRL